MKVSYFIILFLLILIMTGCGKEKVAPPPTISYYFPETNDLFEIPDTIPVVAEVTAETIIESIKVQLTDSNFNPALPAITLYPNSTGYSVDLQYPVTDISLIPGTYYMLIRANIENNFKNQYQKVLITNNFSFESRLLILTKPATNKIDLYFYEGNANPEKVLEIGADYVSSDINAMGDQLFIAGENITNIQAWDLETLTLDWQVENIPYQPMHNPGCLYFDESLYASFNQLYVLGYKPNGEINFDTYINDNDAPGRVYRHVDYLLVDIQKKNISTPTLNTYYISTGALKQEILINFKVVEFFFVNTNTVLVFANSGSNGKIFTYDIPNNSLDELNGIDQKIICVGRTNNHKYLIGTVNSVRSYELAPNIFHDDISGSGASQIAFNQKSGELYISLNKMVDIYNYPALEYQKTLAFSDTILEIHSLISQY